MPRKTMPKKKAQCLFRLLVGAPFRLMVVGIVVYFGSHFQSQVFDVAVGQ